MDSTTQEQARLPVNWLSDRLRPSHLALEVQMLLDRRQPLGDALTRLAALRADIDEASHVEHIVLDSIEAAVAQAAGCHAEVLTHIDRAYRRLQLARKPLHSLPAPLLFRCLALEVYAAANSKPVARDRLDRWANMFAFTDPIQEAVLRGSLAQGFLFCGDEAAATMHLVAALQCDFCQIEREAEAAIQVRAAGPALDPASRQIWLAFLATTALEHFDVTPQVLLERVPQLQEVLPAPRAAARPTP